MSLDGYASEPFRVDLEDKEGLGRLTVAVQRRLRPFVCNALRDHHAAEDVLQETLLTMIERLGGLRRPENLWPWIYRIAWNKVQDHFREQRRFRESMPSLQFDRGRRGLEQDQGLGLLICKEHIEQLAVSLAKLTPRCQTVLYLRCYEQLPYKEIASLMHSTPGRVRVQLHRAKQQLRDVLLAACA